MMAKLGDRFYKHLSSSEVKEILTQTLQQHSRHSLQQQWEKLARANLLFCITVSGIMTRNQLAQYGIDSNFLLPMLSTDHERADAFLGYLEEAGNEYNCAVEEDFLSLLPALLQGKLDNINVEGIWKPAELFDAIDEGDVDQVRRLLPYQVNIDMQSSSGSTLLMRACRPAYSYSSSYYRKGKDMVETLLMHGANPDIQDKKGRTALIRACQDGYVAKVRLLLEHHADVNLSDASGDTPLMWACWSGDINVVALLLQYGADMEIKENDGENAIAIAKRCKYDHIVQFLKDYKAILPENRALYFYLCKNLFMTLDSEESGGKTREEILLALIIEMEKHNINIRAKTDWSACIMNALKKFPVEIAL